MKGRDCGADRAWSLGASATRAALRLLGGVFIARACGEARFGSYALLLSVETILFTVVGCLAAAPLANLVPKLDPARGLRLWRGLERRLTWLGLLIGLGVAAVGVPTLGPWVALGAALSFGLGVQVAVHRAFHASVFRSVRVWEAEAWSFGVPLACGALGVVSGLGGWELFWLGSAAGAAVSWWRLRPRGRLPRSRASHPEFWPLGRTMLLGSLAYTAGSRLQVFVLAALSGPAAVAAFAAALSLAGPLRLGASALGNLLRPRIVQALAAKELARARRWTVGACGLLTLGSLVATGLALTAGAWLADLLYGGSLSGLATVLPWAVFYVGCEAVGSVLVVVVQAHGPGGARAATRLRIVVSTVSLVVLAPACASGAAAALAALGVLELGFAIGIARRASLSWPSAPVPCQQLLPQPA